MDAVTNILAPALLGVLAVLLAAATAFGIAIALQPTLLDRVRELSDRHLSLRRATRPLDLPRDADRWFYRHHRVYGATVIALAIFLLYVLVFGYSAPAWVGPRGGAYHEVALILAEVARIVLWLVAVLALIVGTVVFVRPSALKGVEGVANRWLTPRRWTRGLDREYRSVDTWAARHPRATGIGIALAAAITLAALLLHWAVIVRLPG